MEFKLIRPYQLAEMLGVHRVTIHRMEKRGDLPPRKQFSKRLVGWDAATLKEHIDGIDVDISENEEAAK